MNQLPDRVRRSPTAVLIYRMMPVSQKGLAKKMGMHAGTIIRNLNLLKEHHLIHVEGWESAPTTLFPMWAAGNKADTPRPTSRELAREREKRYRKNNPETVKAFVKRYKDLNRDMLNAKGMARYFAKRQDILQAAMLNRSIKPAKPVVQAPMTTWVGGNSYDKIRVVHSCSSADVAYVAQ